MVSYLINPLAPYSLHFLPTSTRCSLGPRNQVTPYTSHAEPSSMTTRLQIRLLPPSLPCNQPFPLGPRSGVWTTSLLGKDFTVFRLWTLWTFPVHSISPHLTFKLLPANVTAPSSSRDPRTRCRARCNLRRPSQISFVDVTALVYRQRKHFRLAPFLSLFPL